MTIYIIFTEVLDIIRAAPVLRRFMQIEEVEQNFGSLPAVYKSNCGTRVVIKEIKRSSIPSAPS